MSCNEFISVVFDKDGVIADSQRPIVDRFNREFKKDSLSVIGRNLIY